MNDIYYGRVIMYVPSHKPRKLSNARASVSWFVNDRFPPPYSSMRTYLSYNVGYNRYRIYNPQQFKFSLQALILDLTQYHINIEGVKPDSFEVIG